MESANTQVLFFGYIKNGLPPHLSLVDEIAALLNISNDSAYRRIRGEKPISFEELQILCSHYKISLDQFLHLQSDAVIFSGKIKSTGTSSFEDYLNDVLEKLQFFGQFKKRHIYFLMKDIPPYVHFQIPELATFKFYFWMKSILYDESMKDVKFALDDPRYLPYHVISKKIIEAYNNIPMTEIWNVECIISSLRQINFYRESGSFKNVVDIQLLYNKLEELINHIEKQAEYGLKFNIGSNPGSASAGYRMFVNELVTGDNTFFAELEDTRITFLNHSVLYFVGTKDERFNTATYNNINNLMKKSTMISAVSEKERVRFFNQLKEKINQYRSMVN
jgi:hypothetical protein